MDDRPLSGVQEQTLGQSLGARNFLVSSFSVTSQMATSSSASGFVQPTAFNYALGTLDLNRVSGRSELLLHYTGGGMFSSYLNSAIQDLEFTYTATRQRTSLLLGDEVSFLSESPFGFGGVGGLQFFSGPGISLNPILAPNQSIPTIIAPRLSNTAVAQIEYKLSPRSSWTASGSYGTLDFFGANFINSTQGLFQTGYNYSLNPQSSIAVIYRAVGFIYTHLPLRIGDQVVQLGYAQNVTGKLSFQVAAGPSMVLLRGMLTGNENQYSWAVDSSLDYRIDRTMLLLSYNHLVNGGGGELVGVQTGQTEATIQRKLSPRSQGSVSVGYATNDSLVPLPIALSHQNFSSWYAVARFDHQLNRGAGFFASYGARLQATNAPGCAARSCQRNFISHAVSVGFTFGLRPRILQ